MIIHIIFYRKQKFHLKFDGAIYIILYILYIYGVYVIVKPHIWGIIADNHPDPGAKLDEESGYLAIIPTVAIV